MRSIFTTRAQDEVHPLTLSEQIAERIYLSIIEGEFQFGERIREDSLSKQYQVSRGPVREALRILEKDSVVVIQPHRGAHVTELTIEEVRDIFAIRKALISLAIQNITGIDSTVYKRWMDMIARMDEIAEQPDSNDEYILNSARIHLDIADQSSNKRLAEMIRSLARQTFRYTKIALSTPQSRKRSVAAWQEIVTLIHEGKYAESSAIAENLIDISCQNAVDHLQSQNTQPG
jgi:DNA-binding GntR family transcriptional regulator